MNWTWVAVGMFVVYGGIAVWCLAQRRWTGSGLAVAAVNLLFAALISVAPVRGWLDPAYRGFSLGFLRVEQGPAVTAVAGSLLVGAVLSACIALLNRRGWPMRGVAIFDGLLAVNLGVPLILELVRNPESVTIELGEYLKLGPVIATIVLLGLLVAPLAWSGLWAVRRVE